MGWPLSNLISLLVLYNTVGVFTVRCVLSPYIKRTRCVFEGLGLLKWSILIFAFHNKCVKLVISICVFVSPIILNVSYCLFFKDAHYDGNHMN